MSVTATRQTIPIPSWQSRNIGARSAPGTRSTTPISLSPRRMTPTATRPISPLVSPRYQRSRSGSTSSVDEIPPSVALLVLRRKFAHAIATRMKLDQNERQSGERSVSRASVGTGTETDTELDELLKDYEVTISPRGERKAKSKNSLVINKRKPVVEESIQKSVASGGLQAELPSSLDFDDFTDSSSLQSVHKRTLPSLSSFREPTCGISQYRTRDNTSGRRTPDSGRGSSLNTTLDSPGRSPRSDIGEEKFIRAGADLAQTHMNLMQTGQDLRALRMRIVMLQNEVGNVRDEREKMDRKLKMMTESFLKPQFSRKTLKFRLN